MNTSTPTPLAKELVRHLTPHAADQLLCLEGIPEDELPLYKGTILAASLHFWDHVIDLDRIGQLYKQNGRIFSRHIPAFGPVRRHILAMTTPCHI